MTNKNRVACLPTVKRLPMYYRLLKQLQSQGIEFVSSAHIAEVLDLEPIVVRKDMTNIGIIGKPRIGFDVNESVAFIEKMMNYNNPNEAFLIGVGHLGQALLGYKGFMQMGLNIVAAFDCDPAKIGMHIQGKEVFDISELPHLAERLNIETGILCVSEDAAQETADYLVKAGIKGIWNFTPTKLKVPEGIVVQREDLAEGLAVLIVKLSKLRAERRPQNQPDQLSINQDDV